MTMPSEAREYSHCKREQQGTTAVQRLRMRVWARRANYGWRRHGTNNNFSACACVYGHGVQVRAWRAAMTHSHQPQGRCNSYALYQA